MSNYSSFLFAEPSFTEGMGRVLDLAGTLNLYNVSNSASEADNLALFSDWSAVGAEIREAGIVECNQALKVLRR